MQAEEEIQVGDEDGIKLGQEMDWSGTGALAAGVGPPKPSRGRIQLRSDCLLNDSKCRLLAVVQGRDRDGV